jgi:hypothetical protein
MTTAFASTITASTPHGAECASCELGLEHCHGDLVVHDDGHTSCLDGCGGPRTVHDVVVACAEVGMGCCEELPIDAGVLEPAWAA